MKDSESHSHVGGLLLGFRLGQEQPTQVFAGHSRPVRSFADIGNAAHPFVLTSAGDGTIRCVVLIPSCVVVFFSGSWNLMSTADCFVTQLWPMSASLCLFQLMIWMS